MDQGEGLIGLLYDGLAETEPWSAFLERACERFDAVACSILFQSGRSPEPIASFRVGGSARVRARYWGKLYLVDPFVGLPPDTPLTFAEFIARTGGADRDQGFLTEIASPHILGIDVALGQGALVRVRITRSHLKPDFEADTRALVEALVPHMKRAFSLFLRLSRAERERDAFGALPDLLGQGAVMVDCDGLLLSASAAAQAILSRGEGVSLIGGRVAAAAAGDNAALHQAIREASQPDARPRTLRLERRRGGLPLAIVVLPGSRSHEALKPDTLLLLVDPEHAPVSGRGELALLLGLTPAEAGLAMLLGQGLSLAEAAEALGVRMNTVRAQLRAIFAKTGIGRQSELVRAVLGYSATGGTSPDSGGIARSSTISRP